MDHVIADERLLLGTVGWDRPDWLGGYYPADLPADWRLAYYANDCSCVLVPADRWCDAAPDELEAVLSEAPERLVLFLEAPARDGSQACANLALFAGRRVVVLARRPEAAYAAHPQWIAQGPDLWVDSDTDACLVRWPADTHDLRRLRARAETLSRTARALVLDGPAADPGHVPELRTLLQLMGRA